MDNEHVPLLPENKSKRDTRTKVLLYSLIYNCAVTITTVVEPQYAYYYVKNHLSNNTIIDLRDNATTNVKSCDPNKTSDDRTQQVAADWSWYMQIAEAGVSFPVVIFSGPIADRIGRKPVLVWNLIISTISFILKTVIIYEEWNLYYYTSACGVLGLAGSFYTYQITNFAILADVTTEGKDRSFSMVIYDSISAIGSIIFQIGTGYLIRYLGFLNPYIIASSMFFFLTCFVQISLNDPWQPSEKPGKLKCLEMSKESLMFCTKSKHINKPFTHFHFMLMLIAYCLFYFPHCTANGILTLLQLGPPFCWSAENIGWYGAGSAFVTFIGAALFLKTIHSCCGFLSDIFSSIMGSVSCLATYILYGLASNVWIMYASIGSAVIRVLPISLLRALLSEMVHKDKQGALYSIIHIMETILRVGSSTLFNNIYHHTLSIYRGLVFFVMAGFVLVTVILLIIAARSSTKRQPVEIIIEQPQIRHNIETAEDKPTIQRQDCEDTV